MRAARLRGPAAALAATAPSPGSFAAVMATGIVSIATLEHGCRVLSAVLGGLAVAGLVAIAGLIVVRVGRRRSPVSGSLRDPGVVLPLFGAVAACAVVGARFAAERPVVVLLGVVGLVTWGTLALGGVLALRRFAVVELRARARGAWLLPTVATAGLVITAADLTVRAPALLVAALFAWVLSLALYACAIALIIGRAVAADHGGELLGGDSWVVMGALAICTLAGDRMLGAARRVHATGWLTGWLRPATLICWTLATVLVVVVAAAHARRLRAPTTPPRHNAFWWAAVFPLGMYSVSTLATAQRFHLRVLPELSAVFCWVAQLAWLAAAAGLLHASARHMGTSGTRARPAAR